jgi:hypothetical protein
MTDVERAIENELYETVNSLREQDFMADEPKEPHFKSFRERLGREPTEEERARFKNAFVEEAKSINANTARIYC